MSEKLNAKNTEFDDSSLITEERDYTNLIIRLKEIKATIAILEKIISI
tara:strand:- start:708 stop:851 length:144 start_codon:yes stop_codon:yes gene_type:complete